MPYVFNAEDQEAEAGGSRVWGQPGLATQQVQGQRELHGDALYQKPGLGIVVQCLPSVLRTLGLIPNITKKKKEEK
jgi:hypothetical protein